MEKSILLLTILSLTSCAGTHAQRDALKNLDFLPMPNLYPVASSQKQASSLSLAARQLDALIKLQPIRPSSP